MVQFYDAIFVVGKITLATILLYGQQHMFSLLFLKDEEIKKATIFGVWIVLTMLMLLLFIKSVISVNGLLESLGCLGMAFIFSILKGGKSLLAEGRWFPIIVNAGLTAAVIMILFSII